MAPREHACVSELPSIHYFIKIQIKKIIVEVNICSFSRVQ